MFGGCPSLYQRFVPELLVADVLVSERPSKVSRVEVSPTGSDAASEEGGAASESGSTPPPPEGGRRTRGRGQRKVQINNA